MLYELSWPKPRVVMETYGSSDEVFAMSLRLNDTMPASWLEQILSMYERAAVGAEDFVSAAECIVCEICYHRYMKAEHRCFCYDFFEGYAGLSELSRAVGRVCGWNFLCMDNKYDGLAVGKDDGNFAWLCCTRACLHEAWFGIECKTYIWVCRNWSGRRPQCPLRVRFCE